MSFLSNFIKKAAPVVAAVAPGTPIGTAAAVVSYGQAQQDANYQRKLQEQQIEKQRKQQMAEIFGSGQNLNRIQAPTGGMSTANAGFGAGFGSFLGDVGRNIVNPISNIIGAFRTPSNNQQPAVTTIGGSGASETSSSGTIDAGFGSLIPGVISGARNFLTSPGGQIATGVGASLGLSLLGGSSGSMRYPTKQVRIVKAVYNQTGRDLMQTSNILGIDPQNVSQMIMQKLPAPNPAPTASAIKKTRSTIRKLDRMCNLRDEIAKSAKTTTRRRAPMRRATSTTLIKN
jgi:hypothetical protein